MENNYFFTVLDIETSTLFNSNNEPTAVWLSYGYINIYNRNGERVTDYPFRTWEELDEILYTLEFKFSNRKIYCYCHNLAYEFDFLIKNISRPKKMLVNNSHKVISATLETHKQIEFRCSYQLSGKSLAKLGKEIGLKKLEDDYSMILPNDDISKQKWEYCLRDCDIVGKYISIKLKEYKMLQFVPLTKTGEVRYVYKKYYDDYIKELGYYPIWDLMPSEKCYKAELDAFCGGITISNPMFTGMVVNDVESFDIKSSYPYAQLKEQFPYTICEYNGELKKDLLKDKFWIAKIRFNNIKSKFDWGWLSRSKMNDYDLEKSEFFNGKLLYSPYIVRTITNVDYETITMSYDYDDIEVLEFYKMEYYGTLPKPYINTILHFAKPKHELSIKLNELEGSVGKESLEYLEVEFEYMKAKAGFNSIFGMSVQKLIQEEYYIDEEYEWKCIKKDYKQNKNKHIKRNFLFGVYTTAYARRNIIKAAIKNAKYSLLYIDTDSIKRVKGQKFIDTNEPLSNGFEKLEYVKKLGKFERDAVYEKFVTYGAKKYAYKSYETDTIHFTVAGLPKFKANDKVVFTYKGIQSDKFDGINLFLCGTIFNKCKLGKKYIYHNEYKITDMYDDMLYNGIDDEIVNFFNDNDIKSNGGVMLFDVDYTLDMTRSDKLYINKCRGIFDIWVKRLREKHIIDLTNCYQEMLPID